MAEFNWKKFSSYKPEAIFHQALNVYATVSTNCLQFKLRKLVPALRRMLIDLPMSTRSNDPKVRGKIKDMWKEENKPVDWSSDIPYRNPNGDKKVNQRGLVRMFNELLARNKSDQAIGFIQSWEAKQLASIEQAKAASIESDGQDKLPIDGQQQPENKDSGYSEDLELVGVRDAPITSPTENGPDTLDDLLLNLVVSRDDPLREFFELLKREQHANVPRDPITSPTENGQDNMDSNPGVVETSEDDLPKVVDHWQQGEDNASDLETLSHPSTNPSSTLSDEDLRSCGILSNAASIVLPKLPSNAEYAICSPSRDTPTRNLPRSKDNSWSNGDFGHADGAYGTPFRPKGHRENQMSVQHSFNACYPTEENAGYDLPGTSSQSYINSTKYPGEQFQIPLITTHSSGTAVLKRKFQDHPQENPNSLSLRSAPTFIPTECRDSDIEEFPNNALAMWRNGEGPSKTAPAATAPIPNPTMRGYNSSNGECKCNSANEPNYCNEHYTVNGTNKPQDTVKKKKYND